MNTTNTLSFNANKKCIITMGPKQVSVGSVCMLPHSTLTRIISVKDIIICLNAGAKIREFISDKETIALTPHNFANIFNESHAKYLAKFNADIKSPVEKRETYLIDKADAPIPPKPVEQPKITETPEELTEQQKEEERADLEAVEARSEQMEEGSAELGVDVPSMVTEAEEETTEESPETEAEPEEEVEEEDTTEEETSEDQPRESRKNRKRNRH